MLLAHVLRVWAIVFFPGMIVHEAAHALACVVLGVKVTKIKFWGSACGSVTHHATTGWRNFVIAIAPFFVNTAAACLLFWIGHRGVLAMPFFELSLIGKVLLFYWLAFALAYFAFPSETDLRSGWSVLWRHYKSCLLFQNGFLSFFIHLFTLPLLVLAWVVFSVLGFMNQPRAGLAWGFIMFFAVALFVGI